MQIFLGHVAVFLYGLATLYVGQTWCDLEHMAAPTLFGRNPISSLGCLIIAGAPLSYVLHRMKQAGVDVFSLVLIAAAAVSGLYYIHISSNIIYTNDWDDHIMRVRWIQFNWHRPYGIPWNHEHHHPPLYYYLAGIAYKTAMSLKLMPVLTSVRFVSWICYLVFNAFSLMALRRAGFPQATYRICAALLILWPLGIPFSGKISNEPLFFALYAASFYYGLCWYQEGKPRQLMIAVMLAAVALTVRSTSVVLFAVLFSFICVAWARGRVTIGSFITWRWVGVALVVVLGFLVNIGDIINDGFSMFKMTEHWGYEKGRDFPLRHYIKFELFYYLEIPFNNWSGRQSVWEFLLKTSLYGENGWQKWPLARILNGTLLAIVIYTFLPFLLVRLREWRGMRPYILALVIPVIFMLIFTWWKHSLQNHDARHIYPALVCFVIWFGYSHRLWIRKEIPALKYLAPLLVWSFVAMGQYFYFNNIR